MTGSPPLSLWQRDLKEKALHNDADIIELVDVHKSFGTQQVLGGVNLRVKRGSTLVIVGASGQGKSVILKHMLGLIRPDSGEVRLFGQSLSEGSFSLSQVLIRKGLLTSKQREMLDSHVDDGEVTGSRQVTTVISE